MKPIERITVGLSLLESDSHVLDYAAMLAGMGVGTAFRFLHVIDPDRTSPDNADPDEVRRRMQVEVSGRFSGVADRVSCVVDLREGDRVDQLLVDVEQHPSDLILLGHRKSGHARRSSAKRLAMISPTSVWMVPDQAPPRIRRVLAPIDFSSHSADGLSLATGLARQAGLTECLALHVYFDPSMVRYDETIKADRKREEQAFEQFIAPIELHDVNVVPIIEEESNVTKAILRIAQEKNADLIVMSTRGRSAAASALLGSETSQTLMEADVPVLAVKHRGAFLTLFQALKDQTNRSQFGTSSN